jgi:hypothetical protein
MLFGVFKIGMMYDFSELENTKTIQSQHCYPYQNIRKTNSCPAIASERVSSSSKSPSTNLKRSKSLAYSKTEAILLRDCHKL